MSKILITGGVGFIGSHLVKHFLSLGHKVVIVDNFSNVLPENVSKNVTIYKIDIQSDKLLEIFKKEKPDYISHHAAQVKVLRSIADPRADAITNILGTINVLECAQKTNVKKIVFASSGGAVYGNVTTIPTPEDISVSPRSPYAIAKLADEYYISYFYQQYQLPFIILRYANVYGNGQKADSDGGVVAIFVNALLHDSSVMVYGNGQQTRDFVSVDDIVTCNGLALFSKHIGIYNVGTGTESSINELLTLLQSISGKSFKKIAYEKERKGEVQRSALDISKIKKELHFSPAFSLQKGLQKMLGEAAT